MQLIRIRGAKIRGTTNVRAIRLNMHSRRHSKILTEKVSIINLSQHPSSNLGGCAARLLEEGKLEIRTWNREIMVLKH